MTDDSDSGAVLLVNVAAFVAGELQAPDHRTHAISDMVYSADQLEELEMCSCALGNLAAGFLMPCSIEARARLVIEPGTPIGSATGWTQCCVLYS
jgi:hypothetical protein